MGASRGEGGLLPGEAGLLTEPHAERSDRHRDENEDEDQGHEQQRVVAQKLADRLEARHHPIDRAPGDRRRGSGGPFIQAREELRALDQARTTRGALAGGRDGGPGPVGGGGLPPARARERGSGRVREPVRHGQRYHGPARWRARLAR